MQTNPAVEQNVDLNGLQLNMKEAMDIVRDRQEWTHRIFNLIVTIGLTGEQEEEEEGGFLPI